MCRSRIHQTNTWVLCGKMTCRNGPFFPGRLRRRSAIATVLSMRPEIIMADGATGELTGDQEFLESCGL